MSDKPERLYGVPGAESLHLDLMGAYESQIDPYLTDDDWEQTWQEAERTIEEWTVQPASNHLIKVEHIIDYVVEMTAEELIDEHWYEECQRAAAHPDVVEAFTKARELMASKIGYWMADEHAASHKVTWSDANTPLVDGEPLYRVIVGSSQPSQVGEKP